MTHVAGLNSNTFIYNGTNTSAISQVKIWDIPAKITKTLELTASFSNCMVVLGHLHRMGYSMIVIDPSRDSPSLYEITLHDLAITNIQSLIESLCAQNFIASEFVDEIVQGTSVMSISSSTVFSTSQIMELLHHIPGHVHTLILNEPSPSSSEIDELLIDCPGQSQRTTQGFLFFGSPMIPATLRHTALMQRLETPKAPADETETLKF